VDKGKGLGWAVAEARASGGSWWGKLEQAWQDEVGWVRMGQDGCRMGQDGAGWGKMGQDGASWAN
jgi:hypothetical protein